jgi:hypothetical protein
VTGGGTADAGAALGGAVALATFAPVAAAAGDSGFAVTGAAGSTTPRAARCSPAGVPDALCSAAFGAPLRATGCR